MQTAEQSQRWEKEWEQLLKCQGAFEIECGKLDDAARRHHQGLPPKDYKAEEKAATKFAEETASARIGGEEERSNEAKREALRKKKEAEEHNLQAEIEEGERWETEYGAALEEDPSFIAYSKPSNSVLAQDEEMTTEERYAGNRLDDVVGTAVALQVPAVGWAAEVEVPSKVTTISQELSKHPFSKSVIGEVNPADGWGIPIVPSAADEENGWQATDEEAALWELEYHASAVRQCDGHIGRAGDFQFSSQAQTMDKDRA